MARRRLPTSCDAGFVVGTVNAGLPNCRPSGKFSPNLKRKSVLLHYLAVNIELEDKWKTSIPSRVAIFSRVRVPSPQPVLHSGQAVAKGSRIGRRAGTSP